MKPFGKTLAASIWLLTALVVHPAFAAKGTMRDEALNQATTASSNNTGASWIIPSSSSTSAFNSTDTIKAQWSSHYTNPNLRLFCKAQNANKFFQKNNANVPPIGSQAILLNVIQNTDTATCHFALVDLADTELGSNSPSFTIKHAPSAAPQTWAANSPTAPTASIASSDVTAPTSTFTGTHRPVSSNLTSSTPSAYASDIAPVYNGSGSGLSTVAGVGIGAGVAGLVVLLAVGGLLLFLRARQQKKLRSNGMPDRQSKAMANKKPVRVIPGIHETIGNRPVPHELDSLETPVPPAVTVARSDINRNERRGHWPSRADAASRAGSERSYRSNSPDSMRRGGGPVTVASPV